MRKGKEKEEQHQENYNNTDENKKWMHRETERQRRQEMAKLCASLRSLLPLEYIKGRRSISDHMYEAVNYINYQQNKVKQLEEKRDKLKKLCDLSSTSVDEGSSTSSSNNTHHVYVPPYVVVHPLQGGGGVEIMCSYSSKNKYFASSFSLSTLLDIVIREEGLNVVTTISTTKNGRSIHTIRSEDPNRSGIDYSDLQRKLTEAISSSSNNSGLQETNLFEP